MMKSPMATLAFAAPLMLMASANAAPAPASASDLTPYPAAEQGQSRHVIQLPAMDDEQNYKVELIAGKTMQVDCNHHRFGGSFEEKTVEGWGYNYFSFDGLGTAVSTMKGCPAGSEKMEFVRSGSELLTRYNSKLPVVVYAPKDVEIRYRLWRAGEEVPTQ